MTLRGIHAIFIAVCVVLAVFVAAWAAQHGHWLAGVATLAAAAGLEVYREAFLRKTKALRD